MTSYFSPAALALFLPAAVLAYQVAPRRLRGAVLLAASYAFLFSLSGALVAFLAMSTLSVWATGLVLGGIQRERDAALSERGARRKEVRRAFARRARVALAAGVAFNLGILGALKYLSFLGSLVAPALGPLGVEAPSLPAGIGVPVGISFYTLQAVSYLADVHRQTTPPDRCLPRLALYLAFFPQVMEGPIARYSQTAERLWSGAPVTARGLYAGGGRILWGLGKTLVVANRLNSFVKPVFDAPEAYDGGIVALAAVLYTVQLYCDFSGTMDYAVGVARVFGVEAPENFRQPFFSRTASEFWTRWHVTLGAWFRDYVFYPVSLSAPMKRLGSVARARAGNRMGPLLLSGVPLLCVWMANGLWHGAGTQYLLFGAYYFAVIWLGGLLDPVAQAVCERLGVSRSCGAYRAFQHVRTLVVVLAGELVFRSADAAQALWLLGRATVGFVPASLVDGTALGVGMDAHDFLVVAASCLALLVVGALRERGVSVLSLAWGRGALVRWAALAPLFLAIVVLGAYGPGYVPVDPMYAQF